MIDTREATGIRSDTAWWAFTSGVAGLLSGLFLVLFFAFGLSNGEPTRWAWFGPANDLTSAVQAGALVPVAFTLRNLMPDRYVRRWTTVGVAAMAAAIVLPVLLVVGILPFLVQAPLVTFCNAIMFCWLFALSRAGLRHGVLPVIVARAGMLTSLALAAAAIVAAVALLLPTRSATQYASFAVAGAAAMVAWLAFPVWALLVGRFLKRPSSAASAQPITEVVGGHE